MLASNPGRILQKLICIVLFTALSGNGTRSAEPPQSLKTLLENKTKIALNLAEPIAKCVARKDTDHIAFAGCIDWHSAVHGTWALIAIMRATKTTQFDPLVRQTLTPKKIAAELENLKKRPRFELPYGRAWLLRLAIDYEKHFASQDLRKIANFALTSLIKNYEKRGLDLQTGSYNSASWALINMIDYARFVNDGPAEIQILRLIGNNIEFDEQGCDRDDERGNFMAICSNIAMLAARTMSNVDFANWASQFYERIKLPRAVTKPSDWHHYGLNFSRAWGLWTAYALTGEPKFAEAYAQHFHTAYKKPNNWKGNYRGVAHWVAQFGVFALQPLFGDAGRNEPHP